MKPGDLVVVANSGGQYAILVEPWPKDKPWDNLTDCKSVLWEDGWKIYLQNSMSYWYMESKYLEKV